VGAQSLEKSFSALQFLSAAWEAEPQANVGTGNSTFAADLQGKAMVRRNHAEYPAADGRHAVVHDDFMVIYSGASDSLQAHYFEIAKAMV
jgi:hypothetical protein